MAYATLTDMTLRFGETEVHRLSAGDGDLPLGINEAAVDRALGDAAAIIDSFLRRRYLTPIAQPSADIVRAACILARYDLATGSNKEPSAQMKEGRDEVLAWLAKIADGRVTIEGLPTVQLASGSGVRSSDRPRALTSGNLGLS